MPIASVAEVSGPLKLVYRIPGVRDNGGAVNVGITTVAICTSYSDIPEKMEFSVYEYDGTQKGQLLKASISPSGSLTMVTHGTNVYLADAFFATGVVVGGHMFIRSSTPKVVCTAMVLDASAAAPSGVALHSVRHNSPAGVQE